MGWIDRSTSLRATGWSGGPWAPARPRVTSPPGARHAKLKDGAPTPCHVTPARRKPGHQRLRGSGAARAARGGGPSSLHGVPAAHALHCGLCPSSGPPAWMASTRLDARGGAVMYSAGALAFRRPLAPKVRSLVAVRCEGGTCDVFPMMIRRRGPARVERMCLKDTGVVKPGGGRSDLETSSCTHKNLSASAPAGSLSHNTRRVKRRQFIYIYVPADEPPIPSPINLSLNSRIKCASTYPSASQSRAARHAKYTALRYVQGFTARAVRDAVLALPPARTHARRGGSIGSANEERRACHAEPHSPCNPRARGARTGGEKIGRASAGPERWPGRGLPFVLGGPGLRDADGCMRVRPRRTRRGVGRASRALRPRSLPRVIA